MPSERVDITKRGIDAYNAGDLEAVADFLHEDVVAVVSDGMANAGVYRGHEGFARMVSHWNDAWEDFRLEIVELIEEGDAVIVPVVQHGRGRGSGIETSMTAVHLLRFRGDRVAHWRLCVTLEEARDHAHEG
ncbi:MAG: nuclear transport factor 2 family protein [Thermoleophilaceae bacterium]|nr:nuclear transport factor 2 family protein [Thermoleophilaceae bacterium]